MQEHSMTNTHPSPLVEDPYATYDLPTTWLLWVAAMVHGMEVGTEKSKIMTNSTNNISADISMNGKKLEEVTRSVPESSPVQRWHLLSRSPHQDCLSKGSNG